MRVDPAPDPALAIEKLVDIAFIPVCSPRLLAQHGPVRRARDLLRLPLIHDETLSARGAGPDWNAWFKTAGCTDVDLRRGLRFNSADHALDAAGEGAGVLLAHDILAYDDLRTGRLIVPLQRALPAGRALYLVWPNGRRQGPGAQAFRQWIKQEVDALDWRRIKGGRADSDHIA
jgi:LysR family glycine cleavage system transcriptional activator